jgi:hypothetical protein
MSMIEYVNKVLDNKFLLAGVVAIICTIIFYLENRRVEHKYEHVSYLKLCVLIAVAIIGVLFIKEKKILDKVPDTNIKLEIGEPNF